MLIRADTIMVMASGQQVLAPVAALTMRRVTWQLYYPSPLAIAHQRTVTSACMACRNDIALSA